MHLQRSAISHLRALLHVRDLLAAVCQLELVLQRHVKCVDRSVLELPSRDLAFKQDVELGESQLQDHANLLSLTDFGERAPRGLGQAEVVVDQA